MGRIFTFSSTRQGSSHIKSGKPCQDYSLDWHSDDGGKYVAIVCDGHGGSTYVRSERGARLAAEIALRNIKESVGSVSPNLFLGKEGAVTARPAEEEDSLFSPTRTAKETDLTDIEQQQLEQDRLFYQSVSSIREQDSFFTRLFANIYVQWSEAIAQDAANDPFNDYEKGMLKDARIAKAYGTTLMAFVRTPLYWFAFHIGDGKMLCCDHKANWREPVPWDCNCFLNITTSLCESNPIHSFRYAFSGKGDFPVAAILGSDGMDDSWCSMERLQNFYSQILCIFRDLGEEQTLWQLGDYLSRLSEKGSHDDMSMAGILDMDALAGVCAIYEKMRELAKLQEEREKQETELQQMEQTLHNIDKEISDLSESCLTQQKKYTDWWNRISLQRDELQKQVKATTKQMEAKKAEKASMEKTLTEKDRSFQKWLAETEKQIGGIKSEYERLLDDGDYGSETELGQWRERFDKFQEEEDCQKEMIRLEKTSYMEQHNEEALKELRRLQSLQDNLSEDMVKNKDAENIHPLNVDAGQTSGQDEA